MNQIYCVKCQFTETRDMKQKRTKNNRQVFHSKQHQQIYWRS